MQKIKDVSVFINGIPINENEILRFSLKILLLSLILYIILNMETLILQSTMTTNTSMDFLPIVIQLIIAIGFVGIIMLATHLLGPKRKTKDKLVNFESGIPSVGNAREPMAVKYFLVAILFVLFDVEVIFFYPYAVNFKALGVEGFYAVLLFVAFFFSGFYYIIKKGALKWED
ncbi:MAG TPA: NADH-quinone oxidoreductase subunit A [Chitinophagaceae bacterium]|nr:NADH-quinone oxidoreductase subunit A [Chitinophagaceae bacterium]